MLRILLTPLRARFEPSSATNVPLSAQDDNEMTPEDFARDVMIELMRNAVESLKLAENRRTKCEVLNEIQRIMLQDKHTKDVFRELDGFLALMGVLSMVQEDPDPAIVEPEDQILKEVVESTRLVFVILSESLNDHPDNIEYFENSVGYESLDQAVQSLVTNPKLVDGVAGLLLSFALRNFSLFDTFSLLRNYQGTNLDMTIKETEPQLGTIIRPGGILLLWSMVPRLVEGSSNLRFGFFMLFEVLSRINHRNQAILSTIGILPSVFDYFQSARSEPSTSDGERQVLRKLLRRLLEMGANTAEARLIFRKVLTADGSLDADILDVLRLGMKSRWSQHLSLEPQSGLMLEVENVKGLTPAGFTFMIWVWIAELPPAGGYPIFSIRLSSRSLLTLSISHDGKLELWTSGNDDPAVFNESKIQKLRWTHICLVHYPNRLTNQSIRLFIDGALNYTLNWNYPGSDSTSQTISYLIGDAEKAVQMRWCVASAHLLSVPLTDVLARLIHHLGPRYTGNFQDPALIKFLTYDASTSLNMYLSTAANKTSTSAELSALIKAIQDGFGIPETAIIFSLSPTNATRSGRCSLIPGHVISSDIKVMGDVYVVKAACMDTALWEIGGAVVVLRLIQVAKTAHEVSRVLGILTDGLRNSWRNSEDMERLRGYDILADILREKSQLINMTGFETLFEFLGMNFKSPEQSTVVNTVAYRAIGLDFELWSGARKEIQRSYLAHFVTLLRDSRYKKFNIRQRFAKLSLVQKLLFVLQINWYQDDMIPHITEALKAAMQANFSKDEVIKPIVSYLAANLHDEPGPPGSPHSMVSRFHTRDFKEGAEQVLDTLVSTISVQGYYTKFTIALPLTRICLLLLGDKPSSFTASQLLLLIGISLNFSSSFSRKFELISGWNILKTVLPQCWDPVVNEAAFGVLLGTTGNSNGQNPKGIISCPHIAPQFLAENCAIDVDGDLSQTSSSAESTMEVLIEQLMDLHASNSAFRQIFKSQQTTQIFIDAYKVFASKVTPPITVTPQALRISEKLAHFGFALALDESVAGPQRREILEVAQKVEHSLNPTAEAKIDLGLAADTRSVRQRIASARFSIQTIQTTERKRLRKNILDLREHRRQISRLFVWTHHLTSERGLWPGEETRSWRLDETEGPHRIRKKLEPQNEKPPIYRNVQLPDSEANSVMHLEVPPWAESYEISSTEFEGGQLAEEITDDKHRRIRHELEPGDVIDAVGTVARIAGVDSSPGLLIIGRTHIYMLDGLVENDDGEVVDAHDAPRRLFFVPGSIVELDGPQKAQRWAHDQIATFSDKTFLFRDVGLEIYFKDSRSLLVVFLTKQRRSQINQQLSTITTQNSLNIIPTPGILRTPLFGRVHARVLSGFRNDELSTAQRKWQAREISNFAYLSILNQISGRTPSDATQYPTLDLTSPDSYRECVHRACESSLPSLRSSLTKPMGVLTPEREEAAKTRYSNLQSVDEEPFHYGTHFSSSMIVCHFLIRMDPFTHMFKTLQGGDWDLPDRLFSDLPRAYESAARDVRGDVRELIPEFFTCPEFLENSANHDFGVQQNTGERIHDVKLPPWARDDPLLFIVLNRRALESSHVSEHLPAWIDLIWGCKQRDPASLNVFHPLSYEGSIDLDKITNDLEREATVGIIHNFGQTPRKLFTSPHPPRFNHGLMTLPIGSLHGIEEDPHLLVQDARCFRDLGNSMPVREMVLDTIGERIIPCPEGILCVPSHPHEQIEWRNRGTELRVVVDHKVVQVVEHALCNCAAFADSNSLVTGSSDFTVRLWKVSRGTQNNQPSIIGTRITLSHIMRIHTDEVVCVAASRTWSLVVSGSKDGSAALWDLNRGVYVRSIWHGDSSPCNTVNLVAINESTGYIATCSRQKLCLHTINARPMATLDLTATPSFSNLVPTITALAFHEREYSHLGVLATGGPDGSITLRTWTADGTPEGEKAQWEFVTIRTMKVRAVGRGVSRSPSVTALRFLGESLCHGDETGKSFMWNLPD
ncbi:hypothetical protein BD779DRAFT_1544178 [Infundibulicybe gibba]|nr:hypothetical protein BD779DRAFT_1544178 [Infundibulicybe gibba]